MGQVATFSETTLEQAGEARAPSDHKKITSSRISMKKPLPLSAQLAQESLDRCLEKIALMKADFADLRRRRNPRVPLSICQALERIIDDAELATNAAIGPWEYEVNSRREWL